MRYHLTERHRLDTSPICGFPYIMPSQAQKHVTHNEAIAMLDALVQLSVLDRDLATPPVSPAEGDRYIVGPSPTLGWTGQANRIAYFNDGAWDFLVPRNGWLAWVADEATILTFNGTNWVAITALHPTVLQSLSRLGIGTVADATNPLAAKLNKALFTALTAGEGGDGDLRLTLNKETVADVLSLLFQSGFSGRAEIGLAGSDDLVVKVSADGSSWTTALTVDRTTGALRTGNGSAALPALAVGDAATGLRRDATLRRLSFSVDGHEQAILTRGGMLRLRNRMLMRPNMPRRAHVSGSSWRISTTPADNIWFDVCWSAELGLFCAVAMSGTGNRAMTSPDGITWTARTSAADNEWRSVCWSPQRGIFCAVASTGSGDRVMTSPDGVTWTARTEAAANAWRAVDWAPELGLFCAVGSSGSGNRVMTSPDGITWTARTSAVDNDWRGLTWSAELGLFCAVAYTGSGNRVMTSPDGIAWTARTSAADLEWQDVCWSPEIGLFVAVAVSGTGNRAMTSPDGVTWTARTTPADNSWHSVSWAPDLGLFAAVAFSGSGNRVMVSGDGIHWATRNAAADNGWLGGCWSPELGLFGAVAYTGSANRAMTSVSMFTTPYRS